MQRPLSGLRRIAAIYFGGHAALDIVWWVTVLASPSIRGWFELDPERHRVLTAFIVPDSVILFVASAAAAVALVRGWRWAHVLVASVTGGSAYATLYLAGWVIDGGHGWLGVAAMSVETAVMAGLTIALVRAESRDRT